MALEGLRDADEPIAILQRSQTTAAGDSTAYPDMDALLVDLRG